MQALELEIGDVIAWTGREIIESLRNQLHAIYLLIKRLLGGRQIGTDLGELIMRLESALARETLRFTGS